MTRPRLAISSLALLAACAPGPQRVDDSGDTAAPALDDDALARLGTSPMWTYSGLSSGAFDGSIIATGDFNGDGRVDLAMGSPYRSAEQGFVGVFVGRSTTPPY